MPAHEGLEVGPLHVHVAGCLRDVPVVPHQGGEYEMAFDFLGRLFPGRAFAVFQFLTGPAGRRWTWPSAARISGGNSAGVIVATALNTQIRWITFSSSRTLPGHA